MIDTRKAVDFLLESYEIVEFVGVGYDDYLMPLISEVSQRGLYKSFYSELDAVSYSIGKQLANPEKRVCILMNSLGLGKASSIIISLSEVYKIPLLMIVGNHLPSPTEPQYNVIGEIAKEFIMMTMMETGGLCIELYPSEEEFDLLPAPIESTDSLIYLVNGEEVFSREHILVEESENPSEITCEDVMKMLDEVRESEKFITISTSGRISDYLLSHDNPLNFYNLGVKGSTWSLAYGLASSSTLPVISLEDESSFHISRSCEGVLDETVRCVRVIFKYTNETEDDIKTQEDLVGLKRLLVNWMASGNSWIGGPIEILISRSICTHSSWDGVSLEHKKVDLLRTQGFEVLDPESIQDYYLESMESINSPDEDTTCTGDCEGCDNTCEEGPYPELADDSDIQD